MADLLNMAAVTANTFKKAIEVTSQNVSNVSTAGYHRQVADIVSNAPQIAGANNVGGGSRVDKVNRVYDQAIQQQLTSSYSSKSRYEEQLQQSKQVEGVVASNSQGVQTFMQSFFDAAQTLSNDPTSDVNRRLMLNDSTSLQSYIGNMTQVLKDTSGQINTQLDNLVADANSKITAIYDVNKAVSNASKTGSQVPNELLDKR
jgi:flagellar hook-associated protein 1 FlgK